MSINNRNLLTLVEKKHIEAYFQAKLELHKLLILNKLVSENLYKEGDIEFAINSYKPIENEEIFLDFQLKLFLVKNSYHKFDETLDLPSLIFDWSQEVFKHFKNNPLKELKTIFLTLDNKALIKYGKYYHNIHEFKDYIIKWNNETITLNIWKKFRYLNILDGFKFLKPVFEKEQVKLVFPEEHMKKLFFEYSDEVFNKHLKPRCENNLIVPRDKNAIDKLLEGHVTNQELKNISSIFFPNTTLQIDINCLSRCISNNFRLSDLDIHSNSNMSACCALMKYYRIIQEPQNVDIDSSNVNSKDNNGEIKKHYALWFKNMSKDQQKKDLIYDELRNLYDLLQDEYCNTSWNDFKLLFNKNGSNVKIEWFGDAEILNFIFRKLNNELKFEGPKWNVIANYFKSSNPNDSTLSPEKLIANSHLKVNKYPKLVKSLEDLIFTLNEKK